ncbi:TetR/AcrR family transcriptional regulator [Paracoccus suum]|uniref:TetR/AcrR family transcriptional regulator n=2 Tax=Paracoccus suum TaxID=2259340 RepID=A0A344PPJ8_9RHOB|nr:TetR/AcrR family transcriptional regulator [Paracoccus suum]
MTAERADPRSRIISAALEVFAAEGFELATLRAITDKAGVNIAAVNYYFGSKDELLRTVLEVRMVPYVAARLKLLDLACQQSGPEGPTLEAIVEALVRPMVRLSRDPSGGRSLIRMILQARARPREETVRVFVEGVDPVVHRFIDAFSRALPHVPRDEIFWRYNFALGATMQVLTDSDPNAMRLKRLSGGLCDTDNDEIVIDELTRFISAGFRAPPTGTAAQRASA